MTGDDFRATLGRLGISQAAIGRLLRVDSSTVFRWAQETFPAPWWVVLLLRLLEAGAITQADLEAPEAAPHSRTRKRRTVPSR